MITEQNLIKVIEMNINNENKQTVNARDLWTFLESKSDFSTWIKNRLEDFIENQDYIRLHKKMEANNATMIEYFLTLDVAKNIAMIERNEKGKQIRNYFIQIEKEFHNKLLQSQIQLPKTMKEVAYLLIQSEEEKEKALQEVKVLKVELIKKDNLLQQYENMLQTNTSLTISDMLRILHIHHKKGFEDLRNKNILLKNGSRASSKYLDKNLFIDVNISIPHKNGNQEIKYFSRVTPIGLLYFAKNRDIIFSKEAQRNNFILSENTKKKIDVALKEAKIDIQNQSLLLDDCYNQSKVMKSNIIQFSR